MGEPAKKKTTAKDMAMQGMAYPAMNPQSGPPRKGRPYWHTYDTSVKLTKAPRLMLQ